MIFSVDIYFEFSSIHLAANTGAKPRIMQTACPERS